MSAHPVLAVFVGIGAVVTLLRADPFGAAVLAIATFVLWTGM